VDFAYCNDPKINEKNVVSLAQSCSKYQINTLLKFCHDFFSLCLHSRNVCVLFNEVVQLNLPIFISKCKQFIQQSQHSVIKDIVNSNGFLLMNLDAMKLFLQIQPLKIGEDKLWHFLLKWAGVQSKKKYEDDDVKAAEYRSYLLKSVRGLIRFGLMTGSYFAQYVVPENVLNDKELIKVLLYFQIPEKGCGGFDLSPRMKLKTGSFGVCNKLKKVYNFVVALKNDYKRRESDYFFLERNRMNNVWNCLQKVFYLNALIMEIK